MTQLRSGAVDKMASIFTKRIWQPCICQSNEVKREIKKKTVGAKQKFGAYGPPSPPQVSSLATMLLQVTNPNFLNAFKRNQPGFH